MLGVPPRDQFYNSLKTDTTVTGSITAKYFTTESLLIDGIPIEQWIQNRSPSAIEANRILHGEVEKSDKPEEIQTSKSLQIIENHLEGLTNDDNLKWQSLPKYGDVDGPFISKPHSIAIFPSVHGNSIEDSDVFIKNRKVLCVPHIECEDIKCDYLNSLESTVQKLQDKIKELDEKLLQMNEKYNELLKKVDNCDRTEILSTTASWIEAKHASPKGFDPTPPPPPPPPPSENDSPYSEELVTQSIIADKAIMKNLTSDIIKTNILKLVTNQKIEAGYILESVSSEGDCKWVPPSIIVHPEKKLFIASSGSLDGEYENCLGIGYHTQSFAKNTKYNVSVGDYILLYNVNGHGNSGLGCGAMENCQGNGNSCFGLSSGRSMVYSNYNCFFGSGAGFELLEGDGNVAVGPDSGPIGKLSHSICLGRKATAQHSGELVMGSKEYPLQISSHVTNGHLHSVNPEMYLCITINGCAYKIALYNP